MTLLRIRKAATKVVVFIFELPVLILFTLFGIVVWAAQKTYLAAGIAWLAKKFVATPAGQAYLVIQDSFLEIEKDDNVEKSKEKMAEKIKLFAWYNAADAIFAGVFAWLIIFLSAFELSIELTMIVAIVFDILVPIPFLYLAFVKGQDLTLGTDFRRALDALRKEAPITWGIALAVSIIRGAIWNGPEYVILFFRKELQGQIRVGVALVILATFQALFWGWLWMLGYDSVIEPLWDHVLAPLIK